MKGYQIENVLYIFPQDAAQIPSVAETVEAIAIQPELLEAFKALNEDYADIMVPYNYYTMTANPKAWAGHTDDDIEVEPEPEPEPTVYSITVTDNEYAQYVEVTDSAQADENIAVKLDTTTVADLTLSVKDANEQDVELTYNSEDDEYVFTMPASDVTVTASI